MGRGLSDLQHGLIRRLGLAQSQAAGLWGAESRRRWDDLPAKASRYQTDAMKRMHRIGGPLTQLGAAFGGRASQPGQIELAQRDWDRADRCAAEYADGPELMEPRHAYMTYGSLLHMMHIDLPLTDAAQRHREWSYGSEWDRFCRLFQMDGHSCAACPERESRQAAMRRALIRLEDRGLIIRSRGRAWLPELLPGIAAIALPTMTTSERSLTSHLDQQRQREIERMNIHEFAVNRPIRLASRARA